MNHPRQTLIRACRLQMLSGPHCTQEPGLGVGIAKGLTEEMVFDQGL